MVSDEVNTNLPYIILFVKVPWNTKVIRVRSDPIAFFTKAIYFVYLICWGIYKKLGVVVTPTRT